MDKIILTVKRLNEARVRDLEVPANLEVERLAEMIAAALHWEKDSAGNVVTYAIQAEPPGRMLQPMETLEGAGVCDGAWLVFMPQGAAAFTSNQQPVNQFQYGQNPPLINQIQSAQTPPVSPTGTPTTGRMISLGLDSLGLDPNAPPSPTPPAPKPDQSQQTFAWKEIDL